MLLLKIASPLSPAWQEQNLLSAVAGLFGSEPCAGGQPKNVRQSRGCPVVKGCLLSQPTLSRSRTVVPLEPSVLASCLLPTFPVHAVDADTCPHSERYYIGSVFSRLIALFVDN